MKTQADCWSKLTCGETLVCRETGAHYKLIDGFLFVALESENWDHWHADMHNSLSFCERLERMS